MLIGSGRWPEGGDRVRVSIHRDEHGYEVEVINRGRVRRDRAIGPAAVLRLLMFYGDGRLGKASKAAWVEACGNDAELAPHLYEQL